MEHFSIYPQGRIQDFFRRGCTRLLLYFSTNKPYFFFCRISVVIENRRVISRGGGGGSAQPLHPPPGSASAQDLILRSVACISNWRFYPWLFHVISWPSIAQDEKKKLTHSLKEHNQLARKCSSKARGIKEAMNLQHFLCHEKLDFIVFIVKKSQIMMNHECLTTFI